MGMFETLSADALGRLDCWTVEALAGLTEFSNFDGEHHFVQHMDVLLLSLGPHCSLQGVLFPNLNFVWFSFGC